MDEWVWAAYREQFCNEDGKRVAKVNLQPLRNDLVSRRPEAADEIVEVIKKLDLAICQEIIEDCELDEEGDFVQYSHVHDRLIEARTDLRDRVVRKKMVNRIRDINKAATQRFSDTTRSSSPTPVSSPERSVPSSQARAPTEEERLQSWIHSLYLEKGFVGADFVGWKAFLKILYQEDPTVPEDQHRALKIKTMLNELRRPDHDFGLEEPAQIQKIRAAKLRLTGAAKNKKAIKKTVIIAQTEQPPPAPQNVAPVSTVPLVFTFGAPNGSAVFTGLNALKHEVDAAPTEHLPISQQMKNLEIFDVSQNHSTVSSESEYSPNEYEDNTSESNDDETGDDEEEDENETRHGETDNGNLDAEDDDVLDLSLMNKLMDDQIGEKDASTITKGIQRDIVNSPLLSGNIVLEHANDLVPQFGFIGCLSDKHFSETNAKIFQNTNVPFSSFICGVQGSGKSHTTATMLENALIPSRHLGRLKAPASALVFSYGSWSSGGAGFDISEATYLAYPDPAYPRTHVKKVTVLVSPSNPAIKNIYQGPNIQVVPFRLNSKALDIEALSTLMAVDDKTTVPLYMAKVESILRDIACNSKDGSLDYKLFKGRLAKERFDATQKNMLDMRLNLLESFLDMKGNVVEPEYLPGEVTIVDLSDAFITSTTACVLFKLGLDRFLSSSRKVAKLVVLDEAHKYMLDTPGSKYLTDRLASTIRLQRHQGARVIISTQEPTISTDLIALCSVTVIHRFTSPTWYAALKKHISAMGSDERSTMRQIEELETGEALIYAPQTVLGKNDNGIPIKATGRLMKLNIRKRVTYDGGRSIMAL